MSVTLRKGGNVSLSQAVPNLSRLDIGLGWDVQKDGGSDCDLDASALICERSGKVISDQHFVYFNNLRSPDGSVVHTGDNLTGDGEGDDETIEVDLAKVSLAVEKIVFAVSIHEADVRGQSFGQVQNAFIRVVNQVDNSELVRYELSDQHGNETALLFGELYRHKGEWKFRAIGQGYESGLAGIVRDFGLSVDDDDVPASARPSATVAGRSNTGSVAAAPKRRTKTTPKKRSVQVAGAVTYRPPSQSEMAWSEGVIFGECLRCHLVAIKRTSSADVKRGEEMLLVQFHAENVGRITLEEVERTYVEAWVDSRPKKLERVFDGEATFGFSDVRLRPGKHYVGGFGFALPKALSDRLTLELEVRENEFSGKQGWVLDI